MTVKGLAPHRDDLISLCIDSVTYYRNSGSVFRERLGVGRNDTSGGGE